MTRPIERDPIFRGRGFKPRPLSSAFAVHHVPAELCGIDFRSFGLQCTRTHESACLAEFILAT